MRIEVDIDDLPYYAYYREERSQRLEEILQNDSRFAECTVRRVRYYEDLSLNPFVIRDEQGKNLLRLDAWKIDILNESEVVSYISVQIEHNRISSVWEVLSLLMLFFSSILCASMAIASWILSLYGLIPSLLFDLTIVSFMVVLVSGGVWTTTHRKTMNQRRNLSIEASRADPIYIDALRKLARVPDVKNMHCVKELEDIENALT